MSDNLTINEALNFGVEAQKKGEIQKATNLYTAILKVQPNHPDANHNLGVIAVSIGKAQEALPFFESAIDANPKISQFWLSYVNALVILDNLNDAQNILIQAKENGIADEDIAKLDQEIAEKILKNEDYNQQDFFNKAKMLKENDQYDDAINILAKGIYLFPKDIKLITLLSHCYILKNNIKDAESNHKKATKIDPNYPSVRWNEVRLLLKNKRVSEAANVASETNKEFPNDIEGLSLLGTCLRINGETQNSLKFLNRAIELDNKCAEALINRSIINLNLNRKKEALIDLENAYQVKPHFVQIWPLLVNLKMEFKQFSEAIIILKSMIENDPKKAENFALTAACYYHLSEIEPALIAYQRAISINPNYAEAYNNIGIIYKNQNKLDLALKAYNKAVSLHSNYAEAYNNIGVALKEQDQLDQALQAYQKAISINPNYAEAYNNMGNALKDQDKLEEAIVAYNKAISIKPDHAQAHGNLGVALQDQGKLEEAINAYDKALKLKPDYTQAYNNRGNALKDLGKFAEAVEAFEKALSINPDYAEAYNNLGITLKHQGKLDQAVNACDKALKLKPDYAEAYYNLGNALQDQDNLDEAIEAYNKAFSLRPYYAEAQNNLGTAFQEQGKLDEAVEAYNKALSINPDYAKTHLNLSYIKKYKDDDDQLSQVQKLYKREDLREDQKCLLSFALAKMYEDAGKLDQAFLHLAEGNNLRKKLLKYSTHQDENLFRKLKIVQPNLLKHSLKIKKNSIKFAPIFILGMPRSGTTLVEQIISSHSEVTGAGELQYVDQFGLSLSVGHKSVNTAEISIFRDRYLSEVSKLSNGKQFITDKMPQNFLFIALIYAALPEAKIIHVKRNAAATCWSNYKTYFTSDIIGYCYDLKDVVYYYNLYKDLMGHWQSQYGDRIYNLNYEELVSNQDNETRKLIRHLGLSWEAACLSPHKNKRSVRTASQQQVRKEIYKGSSEAWRKYERYLNSAFDSLPF
tara:strand:+ start:429 stop:3359 length:2931 start_codon:yes stop_codon:yes gene_type:complete